MLALLDHQDMIRFKRYYLQEIGETSSLYSKFLPEEASHLVRTLIENRYEVTSDAITQFAIDCRDHESSLTIDTLLNYVATLSRSSYDKFAGTFRDTVK